MLAWTAFAVAAVAAPEVMTPSKKFPWAPLVLSPPIPRMMAQ